MENVVEEQGLQQLFPHKSYFFKKKKKSNPDKVSHFNARGFKRGHIDILDMSFSNSLIIHAALTQPEHHILVRWMGLETQ